MPAASDSAAFLTASVKAATSPTLACSSYRGGCDCAVSVYVRIWLKLQVRAKMAHIGTYCVPKKCLLTSSSSATLSSPAETLVSASSRSAIAAALSSLAFTSERASISSHTCSVVVWVAPTAVASSAAGAASSELPGVVDSMACAGAFLLRRLKSLAPTQCGDRTTRRPIRRIRSCWRRVAAGTVAGRDEDPIFLPKNSTERAMHYWRRGRCCLGAFRLFRL